MDPRAKEILDRATDIQYQYVIKRLSHPTRSSAARALGLNRSSPSHWDNLDELEEAVFLLRPDVIEAAKLALLDMVLSDTLTAILDVIQHGNDASRVTAIKAIWDRVGLPAQSNVDVTSKGQGLTPISFVEIVPPDTDPDDGA